MTALLRAARAPLVLLVAAGFVFALRIMVAKFALSAGLDAVALAVLGNLLAGLLLVPLLRVRGETVPCRPRHLGLYLVLGAVGVAGPTLVSYLAVAAVGAAYTATVYSLSPLLTVAFAAAIGVERLAGRRFAGIVLGFLGMLALVRGELGLGAGAPLWIAAGLAIPAMTALGNVLRTLWWPAGTSALAFSAATLFSSAALVALLAPLSDPAGWLVPAAAAPLAVLVGLTALSQVLNFRLQEVAGAVFFSQLGYWGTGFGVLLAVVLFDDALTLASLMGLVAVVVGGVLARR